MEWHCRSDLTVADRQDDSAYENLVKTPSFISRTSLLPGLCLDSLIKIVSVSNFSLYIFRTSEVNSTGFHRPLVALVAWPLVPEFESRKLRLELGGPRSLYIDLI
jgi:hypothetical protein